MANKDYLDHHVNTNTLAVVVPMDKGIIELSFFQSCTMGVCESADMAGYEVLLVYSDYSNLRHLQNLVENHRIDGVIITRTYNDDITVKYLQESGIPFVTVGCVPDDTVIQVDHNHEEACKELTLMSILKGRKNIGFIGNHEHYVVNQRRFSGYCDALRDSRIKIDPRIIFHDVDSQIQAERVVEDLLSQNVDSIICIDEVISYWVYTKLKKEHIQIPEQVELASCYHSSALENYVPAITTIKYDSKDLGAVASDVLIATLNGKEVTSRTLLPYEFNIKKNRIRN